MTGKKIAFLLSVTLITGLGFFGLPVDNTSIDLALPTLLTRAGGINTIKVQLPGWLTGQEAIASPYRRSVRRTARRTSRRTARRVSYRHGGGYYGPRPYAGAAVAVGTMIAVGTMVSTLPPACDTVYVNGIAYRNCSGTYYEPRGTQWIVVNAP